VALPLRARGEVIGALDVQSTEPGAFSQEDVAVLQTLADQVAVALSNARLFRQAQESLVAERRAYGEISRQAWEEMVRRRIERGFLCDEEGIVPLGLDPSTADLRLTMEQAAQAGQVIVGDSLSVPIPVRDQVVGALNFRKAEVGEPWTDEEVTLLQNMADQLGQALESARLYQDTQRRAAREQLIGEVTARMRETLDIDAVLRTAVREIGESLALHDITVRLEAEDDGVG
jgi:GAF domain-containing protein